MLRPGFRRHPWTRVALVAALLPFAVAACGGSGHTPSTTSKTTAPTTTSSGRSPSSSASVKATLTGQNHDPVIKKHWTYTVTVADVHGHPLSGTTDTGFAFQGNVVGHEKPRYHTIKDGHLRDTIEFPPDSVGVPLELHVVVHTKLGSVTLEWPVTSKK
jgi:hypothetical protein